MNNSFTSIAHLKIFALGLAVVALGFGVGTAAFAQQPERDDFFTQEQEYSEEEYLRELEELEALYDEYLAEEASNEVAIFPEDGQFGRNIPDPIKGQSPEIFITPAEQDLLAETILTEQPTPEVELAEEEEVIEGKSEVELVEEILFTPVAEESAAKPAQEIVEVEETVVEEPIIEEVVVETAPAGEKSVVDLVEEVLGAPTTETSTIESPVVEGSVAEVASEPVPEVVETVLPEPKLEVAGETEAAPEAAQEVVETVLPEPKLEVAGETETTTEAALEVAEETEVAPEPAQRIIVEAAPPAPVPEVVEETEVAPEPAQRIIVEAASPAPVLEVAEETEAAPAPTLEVAEETEVAPEPAQKIIVETASPEPVLEVVEETEAAPAPTLEVAEETEVAPVPAQKIIVEAVSPEPVLEVVEETEAAPAPTLEVAEETEAAPEPVQKIIVETVSPEPVLEVADEASPEPAQKIIVTGEANTGEIAVEERVEIAVEEPSPEVPVETAEADSPTSTLPSSLPFEIVPAPKQLIIPEGTPVLGQVAVDKETVEETVAEEKPDAENETTEIAVENPVPATFVEQIEAVVEITSAEESVPATPVEPVGDVAESVPAEEPAPSTFVEQIEAVAEITPAEEPAPATPAEPVEVATEVAPAEEPAPSTFVEQIEAAVEIAPAEESAPAVPAEPVEAVAEIAPVEEPALVTPAESTETVAETAPAEESAPSTFFGQIVRAVTDIVPVEQFNLGALIEQAETVAEVAPVEEPDSEAPVARPVETIGEIIPVEKPTFEEVEVVEETTAVRRGPFAIVVEESADEVAESPVQQAPGGSSFANLLTAPSEFTQSIEQSGSAETEIVVQSEPVESVAPAVRVEQADVVESVANVDEVDELSLFEQVAVLNLEETGYASQDMFASIDAEDTSEKPQTGNLADLALFQAPPEQGSFDPYPDSTIEAPGETLLAMGEVFSSADNESYPSSAGEFGKYDPAPDPNNPPKGIFGGKKGISLFNTNPSGSTSADTVTGLSVNSFLWRATLDTLSFMPLASADPFGGVVITDWHNNPQAPNERFKVVAYILDKDLRVGALRVSVFRQEQSTAGVWTDAVTDENVHIQLETTILSRARELRTLWLNQQEGG